MAHLDGQAVCSAGLLGKRQKGPPGPRQVPDSMARPGVDSGSRRSVAEPHMMLATMVGVAPHEAEPRCAPGNSTAHGLDVQAACGAGEDSCGAPDGQNCPPQHRTSGGEFWQQAHAAHEGHLQRSPLQLFCAQALVEGGRVVGCLGKLLAVGHAEDGGVVHRPPAGSSADDEVWLKGHIIS